ncbi:MAG: hypothetical protein ACP5N3_02370 [Candidatus Nanoarchaeia archaeon]
MASPISTFISVIPIIELIFIIMLIREIFGIGYPKKEQNDQAGDLATSFANDAFKKSDQKLEDEKLEAEKLGEDIKKTEGQAKEDVKKLVDEQRQINGLTIQGKDRISKLMNGHKQLQYAGQHQYFADNVAKISNNVVVPMDNEAAELGNEVAKIKKDTLADIYLFTDVAKQINKEKKELADAIKKKEDRVQTLAKEIENIRTNINNILPRTKNKLIGEKEKNKYDAEVKLLSEKSQIRREELQELQKEIESEKEITKKKIAQLEQILSEINKVQLPAERKLQNIERNIQSELTSLRNELKNINNCLVSIKNMKDSAAGNVDKLTTEKTENYDKKLPVLEKTIQQIADDYQALSIISANMSEVIINLNRIYGGSGRELNMGTTNELTKKASPEEAKKYWFSRRV